MLAMESGVASALVNPLPPNLSHAERASKPTVAAAKSVVASGSNRSKVQTPSVNSSVVRPVAASNGKPTAAGMNSVPAAVVPAYPRQQQLASNNAPGAVSLSGKVNSHEQATKPLLPIGEGAYQSAEAVAQRTLDADRDCEKGRWNGCLHTDKADIVDGHSYGHLRGAESGAKSGDQSGEKSDAKSKTTGGASNSSSSSSSSGPGGAGAGKAGAGANEKSSAADCFKGLAFTAALLSLSVGAHS